MKRWIPWVAAAIVVVLLGGGAWRAMAARQAQQKALSEASAQKAQAPLQLAADEIVTVRRQSLTLEVPVSGSLRAVESAMVKARVGGELQGLILREGDSVRAGQEIARIDPTEARARLRQAQQQADAAKSQVDINQRQYANNRALVDQGFISPTALVTSQASLEAAQSSHQAAVSAADVARKALDDTVLKSPITGLVAQRLAQPGERVAVDARIIEVVDLSRLELEALLSPADSLAVRVGQKALLTMEGSAVPVPATVARINPSAQAGSRTVPVYLRVEQARGETPLRQGLFVQGTLDTGRAEVLAVPLDAVRTDKPAPYLQTLKDGRVAYVEVKTGARSVLSGQTWVAIEGVAEGTPVIAGRIGQLREGTAVAAAAPAAPASVPRTAP
ncbi:efflux RND transporter periplasmic adaptor subunit [Acidovorax sp. sif1233]|uniref:efflux RND transporter periplasmic adaptor subunit n=1 Tax=unclassified Acidovorax TaxID=2684926 RepID=UPI001C479333|nr:MULTISPECIES: efflux RND transporter periplasmic adaptor subunit [unclassified Acidovorax]MBV7426722.1 efflux RND transporter periplasmic adaptor subunit [Acidovorax sp. sif0732]MBV7447847.1 efflux RND transporter periplasmic adaptor subunit [Acidovorax sp. sif0715]MBV7454880.1 efflux RND transporter periplasmic adaptor subunit [Acidovorax sp. sif1233]